MLFSPPSPLLLAEGLLSEFSPVLELLSPCWSVLSSDSAFSAGLSLSSFTTFAVLLFSVSETGAILSAVSVAVSSAVPFSAASAVTGSMVSIIRPARVPARKRLFLLFMQKPPLRAYRRKGGDFLLFGNRLSCGKVRLDPVALRHRLSPAVPFSVQTRPRRMMHRSSCLS